MVQLRPYQQEDVAAVIAQWESHRAVLGRAATGLGKAVELAALASHGLRSGRVLIMVDTRKLVRQLAETCEWYGLNPRIHMSEYRAAYTASTATIAPLPAAEASLFGMMAASALVARPTVNSVADPLVIASVQTMYSGEEGAEDFRRFDPKEFSVVLLDECELFLAPKSKSVVNYFLEGNPNLKVFGCTATPLRTDGVAMADLFQVVAFDRDIVWAIDQGWLVPVKQAFVRVAIDFSTLKVRKSDGVEEDYSEDEIRQRIEEMLANEQQAIEFAKAILHVCEGKRTIVVCPKVAVARAVAHFLDAEKSGCAKCVFGELGDEEKEEIMGDHSAGKFPILTSVMMLSKGYDDKQVEVVVNCRKTKSKRLYTQILGRGTRPLSGVVDGPESPEERRASIAASAKPGMLMVNLVGVDGSVRDITIADILGQAKPQEVIDAAKAIMDSEDIDLDDAMARAEKIVEEGQEDARAAAEQAAIEEESAEEDAEWKMRRRMDVQASVDVEYSDDLRIGGTTNETKESPHSRHVAILKKAHIPDWKIARMSADEAKAMSGEIGRRWHGGYCSLNQEWVLINRYGYKPDQTRHMSKDTASQLIEKHKAESATAPAEAA